MQFARLCLRRTLPRRMLGYAAIMRRSPSTTIRTGARSRYGCTAILQLNEGSRLRASLNSDVAARAILRRVSASSTTTNSHGWLLPAEGARRAISRIISISSWATGSDVKRLTLRRCAARRRRLSYPEESVIYGSFPCMTQARGTMCALKVQRCLATRGLPVETIPFALC